jgi:pyruvate formate lyase activating enzyme
MSRHHQDTLSESLSAGGVGSRHPQVAGTRRDFLAGLAGSCAACALGTAGGRRAEGAPAGPQVLADRRFHFKAGELHPQPARWYEKLPESWVRCGLCPHGCRISEDERGTCGTRENRGGKLFTLIHSRPCSIALDPVEKKPFFHVLPGSEALSLATPGCNLWCKACQNWEIAQARPEQVPTTTLTPADAASLARANGAPLIACTYTEPVIASEYVHDIAVAGRALGVRTVMVSNGYIQEAPLGDLAQVIAACKVDLKGFDPTFFEQHCGGRLEAVLETLRRLRKHGVWTEIVALIIPTQNDSVGEIREMARFVRDDLGSEVPVHFTRFHPAYRLVNLPATPVATLERCREVAMDEGLKFVYVGNVPGHPGEHTYCPACGEIIIRRLGMAVVQNRLRHGTCPDCGRSIPGIWS